MIQVRAVYQIKFGKIDQAVALFSRLPSMVPIPTAVDVHYHLLSDISGPMYTLVEELMIPSLSDWEPAREALFNHPEFPDWYKEFQLLVEVGRNDFYTLEGECRDWSRPGVIVARQAYQALKW
ncbi:MAG: hypothetical protein ACRDH2_04750, partial [Anaerolineales bacterium]